MTAQNTRQSAHGANDLKPVRTALITGASRGLGLALATALARRGWQLILDARGAEALEAARAELLHVTSLNGAPQSSALQLSASQPTASLRPVVVAIPGDINDVAHRRALGNAARALGGLDALINNASTLGLSPQPPLLDYPLSALETVYRTNVIAPLALIQEVRGTLKPGARVINVSSDAGVEPYPGWGGYGSSKAALEHLSAILAVENPELRVYHVDPGDMRTQMHQDAFPGEDISDRPLPETSVPGFLTLLEGELPSGRYVARALPGTAPLSIASDPKGEVRHDAA